MLDEAAHTNLLAALDVAISRCIDAFNMASESGERDLAEEARDCIERLRDLRDTVRTSPTRPARWKLARTPRGDARPADPAVSGGSLHLQRADVHYGWSRDHPPLLTVPSGSELHVQTQDASGGQLAPGCDAASVATLDFERVNPVCGPVLVEGARAGDVLQVDILDVEPGPYGWTALIPGFGLLADRFPDPWLHVWEFTDGWARFTDRVRVPLSPFCGVLGVAPAEPGLHSVIPPRRVGGNMDTRQLGPGATLYLPVEVDGALFGVGDTHGAQGDGEVCGTAIEAAMTVSLRLTVRRDLAIDGPEFDVTRPLERPARRPPGITPPRASPPISCSPPARACSA